MSGPGLSPRRPLAMSLHVREGAPRDPQRLEHANNLVGCLLAEWRDLAGCKLIVNNNRRSVLTWTTREDRTLDVSVHHSLLVEWGDVAAVILRRDDAAWSRLSARLHAKPPDAPRRAPGELNPKGDTYDLSVMLQRLCDTYFNGAHLVPVGWGRWPSVAPRRGMRLGSCGGDPVVIRVHPCLDAPDVPEWFVEFVLYHELLHVVVPPNKGAGGRREIHGDEFMRLERQHPRFRDAMSWEAQNIRQLLERTARRTRRVAARR